MKREYMTPEMEIQEIEKWDMIVTSDPYIPTEGGEDHEIDAINSLPDT